MIIALSTSKNTLFTLSHDVIGESGTEKPFPLEKNFRSSNRDLVVTASKQNCRFWLIIHKTLRCSSCSCCGGSSSSCRCSSSSSSSSCRCSSCCCCSCCSSGSSSSCCGSSSSSCSCCCCSCCSSGSCC